MKLGVAYNVFDGVELLEKSINSIKDHVDYIVVVFQRESNFGNPAKMEDREKVFNMLENNLINQLHIYNPNKNIKPYLNEIEKRNLGKSWCKLNKCTHFMTMDADEVYISEEFKKAKEVIQSSKVDSSACQMLTYYKQEDVILWPPEEYYVPFIYKLDDREFKIQSSWPVKADPTRKLKTSKLHLFKRNELQMHHFSYVRNDIRQKLENSTASVNWRENIDKVVEYWNSWEYPMLALLPGAKQRIYKVRKSPFPQG